MNEINCNCELWIPIKGYETMYEVSNTGKVRRKHKTNAGNAGSILKVITDKVGYQRVCLCKNGKSIRYYVHRLVANAFVNGSGTDVNHINGDKSDNCAINLEWCSHEENMRKAVDIGLIKSKGVYQIKNGEKIATYQSLTEASKETGINKSNISKCCNGDRHTAGGYEWEWANVPFMPKEIYLDCGGESNE